MNSETQYWLEEVRRISSIETSFSQRYKLLYHLLVEFLCVKTSDSGALFSGPMSRMSYISDKCSFPYFVHLNSFRYRCRHVAELEEVDLRKNWHNDINVFISFISYASGDKSHELKADDVIDVKRDMTSYWRIMRVSVISVGEGSVSVIDNATGLDYPLDVNVCGVNNMDLKRHTRLNLIDVAVGDDGLLHPELIVYEPDMLTDVSTVARCFEEYGETEKAHLLDKFKPREQTRATLLGNLASQMLDDTVNLGDSALYKSSVNKFFRNFSVDILTCPEINSNFHNDALAQMENIKKIICTVEAEDPNYSRSKVMLEPSFVCEALGLQGRMDLMQSDYRLLIEQKSGKKDEFRDKHRIQHYVQMLLYLAVIHYGFGLRNEDVSCYLLYSKYPNGLLRESSAPQLLRKAIGLRNRIVAQDIELAQSDGARCLIDPLSAESLNVSQSVSKLWNNYQKPSIDKLLQPLHQSSDVARDYFYRFFSFLARENIFSRIGNNTKENSGFASIWNSSLDERRRAGNIMDSMTVSSIVKSDDGVVTDVVLERNDDEDLEIMSSDEYLPNFRKGDVVIFYTYRRGKEPDVRRVVEHRATVVSLDERHVELHLRNAQRNVDIWGNKPGFLWAVEHDYIDSSYGYQYRALYALLLSDESRRQLLLSQRSPVVKSDVVEATEFGSMNDLVTRVRRAEELFLIVGPPGTGKTSFGLMSVLRDQMRDTSSSVLLMAYTNRAVDEICSKLKKESIDFVRFGHPTSCDERYRENCLENRISGCRNVKQLRDFFISHRVFVGTTTSVSSFQRIFEFKRFDLAIVDEASQILEPAIIGLLSATSQVASVREPSIKKIVLIGDHKQLPAVVSQSIDESSIKDESLLSLGFRDCAESLFQRLFRRYHDNQDVVYTLSSHGRMHPEIADFVNKSFYSGCLSAIPLPHQSAKLNFSIVPSEPKYCDAVSRNRWIMIDVPKDSSSVSDKANCQEAEVIADVVESIYALRNVNSLDFSAEQTVGIIVPYRNQIAVVRNILLKRSSVYDGITIDTVERFQGSERDVIIYGFTVSRQTQLSFLTSNTFVDTDGSSVDRRLNVALSRAREQNIIVGNRRLLSTVPIYDSLIRFISSAGAIL